MKKSFAAVSSVLIGLLSWGKGTPQETGQALYRGQTTSASAAVVSSGPAAVLGVAVPTFNQGCPAPKICVSEPKPHLRNVYGCKTEEYCLPGLSFGSLLRCNHCADGECGDLRVRHRLVVKKVHDHDTTHCVPRPLHELNFEIAPPPLTNHPTNPGKR
jgi:hypothetical protein